MSDLTTLLVAGGRTFANALLLHDALAAWVHRHGLPCELIHGGAPGADAMAGAWATEAGVPVRVFRADWGAFGRAAGPKRNQQMVDHVRARGGHVLLLPGGTGTADLARRARGLVGIWDWRE